MTERERRVISLVGGGGKTTTMYALAEIFREAGKKVVVTTSTHLQTPCEEIRARNIDEVRSLWADGNIAAIGSDSKASQDKSAGGSRRVCMPEPEFLQEVLREADVVLIEADGAKQLPCKVPRDHEPVIIPECTEVVAVTGMDTLDEPLEDICFGRDYAVPFLGVDYKHLMTEEDIVKILSSVHGARKGVEDRRYYVVLNKCDDEIRKERAGKIRSLLKEQGIEKVMITSHENRKNELKKYFIHA